MGMFMTNILIGNAATSDLVTTALSLIIPGLISVALVVIANKYTNKTKKEDTRTDIYKTELEQLNRQREMVTSENDKLREDLKEELEDCRRLRQLTEETLEEMKRKINTIEAELFAWRNGFRSPDGYMLVKIPDNQLKIPDNQSGSDDKKNNRSNSDGKKE